METARRTRNPPWSATRRPPPAHVSPVETFEEDAVITGEEDEDVLLELKAKLYSIDAEGDLWLERGMGTVKLLKHKVIGYVFLLMRVAKTLKILDSTTEMLENGSNALDHTDCEPKVFFAIQFKSVEDSKKFKDLVNEIAESLSKMEGKESENGSSTAGLLENLRVSGEGYLTEVNKERLKLMLANKEISKETETKVAFSPTEHFQMFKTENDENFRASLVI